MFLIAGGGWAIWAALIPFARARLLLGDGGLGLLLLGLSAGSIAAMQPAGRLVAAHGSRAVLAGSGVLMLAMLPVLSVLDALPAMLMALLLFGVGLGGLDVAMNVQAVVVERAAGRPMLSGFHAWFSLGAAGASGGMALLLRFGLPATVAAGVLTLALLGLGAVCVRRCLGPVPDRSGAAPATLFVRPRGVVLRIGVLAGILFLVEGAMLDWSGVFLSGPDRVPTALSALGTASFAGAMMLGRFAGDRAAAWLGPRRLVGLSAGSGAVGLAVVVATSWPLAGFALVGLGCANIVPLLFSAAGRQSAMPVSQAVPAVAMLGYGGMLLGPALVGLVARAAGLGTAFLLLGVALGAVAVFGAPEEG